MAPSTGSCCNQISAGKCPLDDRARQLESPRQCRLTYHATLSTFLAKNQPGQVPRISAATTSALKPSPTCAPSYSIGMGTCRANAMPALRSSTAQAPFIDGFKQARAGVTMHLDCQSDDLFGQWLRQKHVGLRVLRGPPRFLRAKQKMQRFAQSHAMCRPSSRLLPVTSHPRPVC